MVNMIRLEAVCAILGCCEKTYRTKHKRFLPVGVQVMGKRGLWWDRKEVEAYKKNGKRS